MAQRNDDRGITGALGAMPALARLAASTWVHAAERGADVTVKLGSRVARAALGASPLSEDRPRPDDDRPAGGDTDSRTALRERGARLLARSAEVGHGEEMHPAYARILDNLSPDEARILRLLATGGPQPAIDVRHGLPLVSELVAPGLNLIGAEAGCRYPDRVAAYLDNLNRLGLIWFSRETLRDVNRYQVLEAQPEVLDAMSEAGRTARTVRRSIHLTPFGNDFCEVCLPFEAPSGESRPAPERPGASG